MQKFACAGLQSQIKVEAARAARLQAEQARLEMEQRRDLELAEKELCASTLAEDALMELMDE